MKHFNQNSLPERPPQSGISGTLEKNRKKRCVPKFTQLVMMLFLLVYLMPVTASAVGNEKWTKLLNHDKAWVHISTDRYETEGLVDVYIPIANANWVYNTEHWVTKGTIYLNNDIIITDIDNGTNPENSDWNSQDDGSELLPNAEKTHTPVRFRVVKNNGYYNSLYRGSETSRKMHPGEYHTSEAYYSHDLGNGVSIPDQTEFVGVAVFTIAVPVDRLDKENTIKIDLMVDTYWDGEASYQIPMYEFKVKPINLDAYSITRLEHKPSVEEPGRMQMSAEMNSGLGKNHAPFELEWQNMTKSIGRDMVVSTVVFDGFGLLQTANSNTTVNGVVHFNEFVDYRFSSETKLMAYAWPYYDDFTLTYDESGYVNGVITLPIAGYLDGAHYIGGDAFEIQRSTAGGGFMPEFTETVATIPYEWDRAEPYVFTDDVRNLAFNGVLNYRIRRTKTADVWGWKHSINREFEIESKLVAVSPIGVTVNKKDFEYPAAEIRWNYTAGIWPEGTVLRIVARNLTLGTKINLADLNMKDAAKGVYYDETLVSCNSMAYSIQLVLPKGTNYEDQPIQQVPGRALYAEIGTISDLDISKGYYADRVELKWKSKGVFDSYRIRRVEYGVAKPDTVLVETISAAGTELVIAEDRKGAPGVYYSYIVDGMVVCDKTSLYTDEQLTGVGFRSPTGSIYGRVTYENGQAVSDADIVLESDRPVDGKSIHLDGTDDYMVVDKGVSLGEEFTLQAYILPEDINGSGTVLSKGEEYELSLVNGQLNFTSGGKTATAAYKTATGFQYTHVTAVRSKGRLVLYINGKEAGKAEGASQSAESEAPVYMGRNMSGNYFKGNIDEVRLWNKVLSADTIARDYTRQLYGGEKGLAAYWRFNDGISGEFYDLSFEGNLYHANHGKIIGGKYDEKIPATMQLCLKGITNLEGYYEVNGIPYEGQGTMYRAIPRKGTHQFNPTQQQRLIAEGALSHTCDFTDNSSFPVSGYVYYENSTVPVRDAMFYVDGLIVMESNGTMSVTDAEGKFNINVPVGIHDVRVVKPNHVFCGEGRITNSDGTDRNYQDRIENIHLYDSTRIKVVGRVAGGALQDSYPLGHSLSTNNLSDTIRVTMKLAAATGKLCLSTKDSLSVVPAFCPTNKLDKKSDWNKKHFSQVRYNILDNQIEITPDMETGEFTAWVIPENFNMTEVQAGAHGNLLENTTNVDLRKSLFEQASLYEYEDSVQIGSELIYNHYSDTVKYNYAHKIIKRVVPSIELTQLVKGKPQEFFGDEISIANRLDGKKIKVPVYDKATKTYLFGHPFYQTDKKYVFEVKAFEEFKYYDKQGNPVEDRVDRVPVSDGVVNFNNRLSYDEKIDTVHLDFNGTAQYTFNGGRPNVASDDALKKMDVTLTLATKTIAWNGGKPLEAVITGGRPEGQRFVTRGPDQLQFILRDPPGSHSYAYIEEGLSTSSERRYVGMVEEEGSETWHAYFGNEIVTFTGVGSGKITSVEIDDDNIAGVVHKESIEGTAGVAETQTYTTAFRTSGDSQFVGADGDLFVGNSTNLSYGSSTCVYVIPSTDYDSRSQTKLAESGDYMLVRSKGLDFGIHFSTLFAYPQAHIENVMIPELQRLRDDYLLPNTVPESEAQAKANSTGKQVYLSVLDSDDPNFGANNTDEVFKNYPNYDKNRFSTGPSYKTIIPAGQKTTNDTIVWFNQQISTWTKILERNEREKVQAKSFENYSFHAGSEVEYSREFTHSYVNSQEFSVGIGATMTMDWGSQLDDCGMMFSVNETGYFNNGGSFAQDETDSCKAGFVLADEGTTDYHTVDVCEVPMYDITVDPDSILGTESYKKSASFVYRLRGGATSCPFEEGYTTKYYKKGTVIDQRTAQIEVPELDAVSTVALDVPSSRKAVYKLILRNASEIGSDCVYDLNVIDSSNPDGAKFYIDGTPLGNGRSFLVPAGEDLYKTLEVGIGTALEYEDLQLVLHSQCQYTTMDFKKNIGDTLNISAYFVPSCSDIHLTEPKDKWTLNTSPQFVNTDGDFVLHMKVDGYDANYKNFESIQIQYKPSSASDADWVTVMSYYPTEEAYNNAQGAKAMLPPGGVIKYDLNMQSLPDQRYDVCAVAVCANGIMTISNVSSGIKDTKRPQLFGSALPADGILDIEDEIRLNFNEPIAEGLLTDNNFEVTGTRNGEILSRAGSVRFDGDNDYLYTDAERNLAAKDFTVETGLFVDQLAHESTIFSHGDINNSFEITITADKKLKVRVGTEYYVTDDALDMKPGEWEHLAVVYYNNDEPRVKAYYNKYPVMDMPVVPYTGAGIMEIGRSMTSGNYFCGKLSEFRIWDQALSLGILNKNKDISLKGSEMGLMAYYPMDECRGELVLDKARGANAVMKDAEWFINRQGYAAEFNGNSYLKLETGGLPVSFDMDYTLEFWFKGEPGQKDVAMVANGRGDGEDYKGSEGKLFIGFNENGKLVLRNNSYTHLMDKNDYLDNTWHHFALAVNRNIGRATVFIDGEMNSFFDASNLGTLDAAFTYLGARGWYGSVNDREPIMDQYFKGAIDEFRIWNMYRNETIVHKENNINLKGSEMGLFTYYPFEKYISHQGTKEMQFTTSDMTLRGPNGVVVPDAQNTNVVKTLDSAPVKERGAIIPIQINYVVNNDALIITPYASNGWDDYEESIVTFKVKDVQDVNRNAIMSPIAWTAYIDRNQLRWAETEMNIRKPVFEEAEFTVDIVNLGGSIQYYSIENQPSWLKVTPITGNIDPKGSIHVKFEIDKGLNVGTYNETIYLVNEGGVARALELNVKVMGEKPDWKVNPEDFKYNMSVYGKLRFNNIFSIDKDDMIAAFLNGKCVGVTNNKYFEGEDMWYSFLTVYSNDTQNTGLEFRMWDDSTGKIYLAKGNKGDMPFVSNKIYGTPDDPVIFDGEEMMCQNIPLKKGWNWISFNLYNPQLNDVDATLGSASWNNADEVKNDRYTSSYSVKNDGWYGTLSKYGGFNNHSMYMLRSSQEQLLSLSGVNVNVKENPITVHPNWNYIGYPVPVNMTLKEALADYNAETGDVLKSQTGFAMYSDNHAWVGNLTYMEANRGYMLYRNPAAETVSFKYPANTGSLTRQKALKNKPVAVMANLNYSENMNVIAVPAQNFELEEGDNILAYVNGEVRGKAQPVAVGNDKVVWFINVAGEAEAPVTFAVERNGKTLAQTAPTMNYHSNDVHGTIEKPIVLDFVGEDEFVNVYPRSFDYNLNVSAIRNGMKTVEICIYSVNGQLEKKYVEDVENGIFYRTLDLAFLTDGHHIVSVSVDGAAPQVFKVEKK